MNKIKIIADSTCDLSKQLIEKHDIEVVPLLVSFGDESYYDGVDITTEEMYKKVEELNMLPKTSAVSPGDLEKAFRKYLDQDYQIIFIGVSSKLSGTYQSANIAKELINSEDIYLIDSENLSSGIGLLILKAAYFRDQGDDIETICNKVKALVPKVRSQFVVDTLEYLYKGGRLNALGALMGKMLKVHPLIKVVDGKMQVGKKAFGAMKKGLNIMIEEAIEVKDQIDPQFLMITHSMADKYYPYVYEKVKENLNIDNIYETHAGSGISTHCGAGTIGILYIVK